MWKSDVPPAPVPAPPTTNVVMDLGKSIVITGELSASEDLTLYGQMDGRVTLTDHTLTIGPNADIRAEIAAKAVVVMGTLTGNVTATERVAILAAGSVVGDIAAPRLAMEDGGQLAGKVSAPVDVRRAIA